MIIISADEKSLLQDIGDTLFGFSYNPETSELVTMHGDELYIADGGFLVVEGRGDRVFFFKNMREVDAYYDII